MTTINPHAGHQHIWWYLALATVSGLLLTAAVLILRPTSGSVSPSHTPTVVSPTDRFRPASTVCFAARHGESVALALSECVGAR